MSNHNQVTVHFSCPHCRTVYCANQKPRTEKRYDAFHCRNCGTPVHEWTGQYDFLGWNAVAKSQPNGSRLCQDGSVVRLRDW
jgi:peptide subunit release factor 1 (eRF1)